MKKAVSFWAAVLLFLSGHTQLNISGQVTTETGKAVAGASITLSRVHESRIIAFAITNENGLYTLHHNKSNKPDSLQLKVSAAGFGTQSVVLVSADEKINFKLTPADIQLPEVVVKAGKPSIRYKADTLTYAVDSFKQEQDRTIGDVLRRLPGIEVNKNGTISFNGQPISNFYIDGDDVLADKYNIATNSVGADMVKDVQVLENHQPIKVLSDITASDKVALNLNLKSTARLKLTARIETGVGYGDKGIYDGAANLMVFKKKFKAIHSLKANNSGVDIARDVLSHNLNDFLKNIQQSVPADMLGLNYPRNPSLEQQRYLFNRSALVHANNLFKTRKNVQLRFNIHHLADQQEQLYLRNTYFYLPTQDTVAYLQHQETESRMNSSQLKFTVTSNQSRFYYSLSATADFSRQPAHSITTLNQQTTHQGLLQKATNLTHEFNGLMAATSKNIFEIYSYFNYLDKPERLTILPGPVPAIFNTGVPYKGLLQEANIPSFFTHQALTYRRPSRRLLQTYKAGFTRQWQDLKSYTSILQPDYSTASIADSFSNRLHWTYQRIYFNADYEYPGTRVKVTLSFPMSYQYLHYFQDRTADRHNRINQLAVSPNLNIKYSTGIESYLLAKYRFGNEMGTVQDVYDGYVLQHFNQLSVNSIPVNLTSYHNASLSFHYRKSLRLLFISAMVNYSYGRNNSIINSLLGTQLQIMERLPYQNSSHNLSLSASLSKFLYPLKTNFLFKGTIQQNEWVQMQNGKAGSFINTSSSFSGTITPKVNNKVNLSFTGNYINNYSKAKYQKNVLQSVLQMWHSAEVNFIPRERLLIKVKSEHYFMRQRQTGESDHFLFADLSLLYKPAKTRIDLCLDISNLANVKQYKMNTISANSFQETAVLLRPRMILLKALYHL